VGVKMLLSEWYKPPILVSLGVIAAMLVVATVASLRKPTDEISAAAQAATTDGLKIDRSAVDSTNNSDPLTHDESVFDRTASPFPQALDGRDSANEGAGSARLP
jgi:hypothetical protein